MKYFPGYGFNFSPWMVLIECEHTRQISLRNCVCTIDIVSVLICYLLHIFKLNIKLLCVFWSNTSPYKLLKQVLLWLLWHLPHSRFGKFSLFVLSPLKGWKKVVISDVFCSRSISWYVFCCCFSHQWGRPTAAAESTKKMWKITIRNGWRNRLRASSIKQVSICLSVFLETCRVHLEVSLFSSCS